MNALGEFFNFDFIVNLLDKGHLFPRIPWIPKGQSKGDVTVMFFDGTCPHWGPPAGVENSRNMVYGVITSDLKVKTEQLSMVSVLDNLVSEEMAQKCLDAHGLYHLKVADLRK